MPSYQQYCRPPLVDPAYAALPDGAVHVEGRLRKLTDRVLQLTNPDTILPLDAVLASKLGEYTDLPPCPAVKDMAAALPGGLFEFIPALRAAVMTAVAEKDKNELLQCLRAMRIFAEKLPDIGEYELMPVAADAMRCAQELYRRTGQKFLLALMERLRAQLPDVSGMFHSFPFLKAFTPEPVRDDDMDEASQYFRRMRMLGTGTLTADALAITAQLALYSGSARDASASKAGVAALQRYHGLPHGAFSADPYLAGRDPSRSSDITAVCAQLEALHDLLAASGNAAFAERMQRIAENALANAFQGSGVCEGQAVNRLAGDETCKAAPATPAQSTALLRALYAVRRSVWMVKGESELAMFLPYESCCLTRMDGTPVRICAKPEGPNALTVTVETKQPVEFSLSLYAPGYAQEASVSVNGEKPRPVACGRLHTVKRMFKTGDAVTLHLECKPFLENGFRGSASVYCGALLMALPLPDEEAAWQYALIEDAEPAVTWEDGRPRVCVDACDAEGWAARGGVIQPPPQGVRTGDAYELTLLPYADTQGRIAAFPRASHRA